MKSFSFLSPKIEFNGITLTEDIVNTIYVLCDEYNEHVENCRQMHLDDNPETNPDEAFEFVIYNHDIQRDFPEGKLWHGGRDYDEDEDRLVHYVYLDSPGFGELDDYFIEVVDKNNVLTINKIQYDRSRWE